MWQTSTHIKNDLQIFSETIYLYITYEPITFELHCKNLFLIFINNLNLLFIQWQNKKKVPKFLEISKTKKPMQYRNKIWVLQCKVVWAQPHPLPPILPIALYPILLYSNNIIFDILLNKYK